MSSDMKTTATNEEEKPALVPKLRFPEFQNAVEWENKPLSTCLDYQQPTPYLVSGTNYSPAFKTPVLTAGKTFILGYTDEEHGIFSQDLPVIIFDDFTTATQFVDFPFKAKSSAMKILQAQNGANIKFMFETLQTLSYEVGAHERHWISNFAPMLVPVPKPPEQQKIAECLRSVDELIAAQARKVDELKTHKNGLMQQLFPREGETQPRLRFPEFQNAGEWEPKLLGDVVKSFKTGKLDANAMVENGQYRFYTCAKNYYQIDCYAFEGEALLVAGNGAHLGYIHHYIGKFNAYQRTYVLQKFQANVVFLRCLLDRYLPSRIEFERKDGNTPYIVLSTLTEMPLVIPKDPDEQQRIADCLTSFDDIIAAQTRKHEALKTHKNGLMQQLFPSPEEVEA
jgi:type I restriction enzyme S subunit